MSCGDSEILTAVREARRALVTPDLASICHAQECLCTAEATLRAACEGGRATLADHDWDRLRLELSLLQDFVGGILGFFATALDVRQVAAAECSGVTGACVSWSG